MKTDTDTTMIDTISAITDLDHDLDDHLFDGGSVTEDFATGRQSARLWHNPSSSVYEPRVTYWPAGRQLKVEFSVPKLIDVVNPALSDVDVALDLVNAWLSDHFGDLPDLRSWRCQRIDYAWTFDVDPGDYLPVLDRLDVSRMTRHGFRGDGVVWKAGNRWIKFYDKRVDNLPGLRFEVSNYRDALRYMCDKWFVCERVVRELVHPGRALYVLAWAWSALGLSQASSYQSSLTLFDDLRHAFGSSVSSAYYHLNLLRSFGRAAVHQGLTSASSFSRWKRELCERGFVTIVDDETIINERTLVPLRLPINRFLDDVKNLNIADPAPIGDDDEKILWKIGAPGAVLLPEIGGAACL
jgi:hypothetical protein